MDLLETIYLELEDRDISKNPFVNEEADNMLSDFYNEYINGMFPYGFEKQSEAEEKLVKMSIINRETGFRVGFRTAIELIFQVQYGK